MWRAITKRASPFIRTVLLSSALAACRGAEPEPTPPNTTPSLTLSLSAASVTVRAGEQALLQVVLTRANLSRVVRLTISDLPLGLVGSFTAPMLPDGTVASTLLLDAALTAAPGTYTAIVTASAEGVNAQALPLSVTITPVPTIVLKALPESLSVIAGGSESITLDIARTGFTGPVFFESEGAPPGVTTTFPDSPAIGSLATALFTTTSDVLPGVYLFPINGFAAGVSRATTFVQLTVLAPLIAGFDVRVTPEVVTLRHGAPDSTILTLDRRNYDEEITLSVAGLPEGVGMTLNPTVTRGTTATATFFAGPETPVGTYALAVIAAGAGVATASANLTLVVEETPALMLEAQPETLTVVAGDSTRVTLTLMRTNLPGEVQLSATGAPVGVVVSFAGNPTTANSVLLTLAVAADAAPGSYLITIHAHATGIAPVDLTLTLTIALPP
ncbi:MAG: hypothetical protein H7066_00915 [Cytophagaceae bacterium]|nr:hypothetical protein [Gemmatimonadaceae bacterium]